MNYSQTLESPWLDAMVYTCSGLWLSFNLKLENQSANGLEHLSVEILSNNSWKTMAVYSNSTIFDWDSKLISINQACGDSLKIRFKAYGENSSAIIGWYVDNISVYPICNPATNLSFMISGWTNMKLFWNAPECSAGVIGILKRLNQWYGNPILQANGYYQNFNYAYGVVYDLSGYQDATLSKIDFHHTSWGLSGVWQYKIHVVDWLSGIPIEILGPYTTTGNDKWETNISLGNIMSYGGGLIGIMLEPMSNVSTDAYPCFTADNDGPEGVSVYGVIPDYATFGPGTIGDFYQSLWIYTFFDKKQVYVKAPALSDRQLTMPGIQKNSFLGKNQSSLTANQKEHRVHRESTDGVIGYNIYLNGQKVNSVPVLDTFYLVPSFGYMECYSVTAVHEGNDSPCESSFSNVVCGPWTGVVETTPQPSINVFPNPANEFVTVYTARDIINIELIDNLGQCVYKRKVDNQEDFRINTQGFRPGIYFIRCVDRSSSVYIERITVVK